MLSHLMEVAFLCDANLVIFNVTWSRQEMCDNRTVSLHIGLRTKNVIFQLTVIKQVVAYIISKLKIACEFQ